MFVYDVVIVQCKKITKFGSVPNIQGANAVFRLGKPSFKKENLFMFFGLLKFQILFWVCLVFLIFFFFFGGGGGK